MEDKVLVLNGDGSVWDVQVWNDVYSNILLPACKWDPFANRQMMENYILEIYDNPIKVAGDKELPRPAVIFLPMYIAHSNRSVRFSRWNVFLRDRYVCQYCGTQCGYGDNLPQPQLEHIHPISLGGRSNFDNTTTACHSCNSKKASLTEKDFANKFGMRLSKRPERPGYLHPARFLRYITENNVKLWLKSEDSFIPDAKFFAKVMRLRTSVRQRILEHFEEMTNENG